MTVRLDSQTLRRLERLARSTARSKAFLAQDAIREYLALNEWQIEAIREGVRAADEGQLVEGAEVETWVASWGRKSERKPPR